MQLLQSFTRDTSRVTGNIQHSLLELGLSHAPSQEETRPAWLWQLALGDVAVCMWAVLNNQGQCAEVRAGRGREMQRAAQVLGREQRESYKGLRKAEKSQQVPWLVSPPYFGLMDCLPCVQLLAHGVCPSDAQGLQQVLIQSFFHAMCKTHSTTAHGERPRVR